MKAYSEDLRLRVVAAVDGGMPRAAVARVFEVGSATITRYLRLRRETGGLGPRPRHGPPPIKTAALRAELLPRLEAQPDATLEEQKKSLIASERNEAARQAWRDRAAGIEPRRWVWLDETGSHRSLTRRYARGPRGERAVGRVPSRRGQNRTLITTLTLDGFGPGLLLDGALNRAAFEAYVDQILAPTLRPGQIVVADNLRAHDSDAARAAIEARGAELWFLPGYSPDLNPIEEGFAKLKAQLRRDEPRTDAAVSAAIWQARRTVTPGDARGFFTHCGYLSSDHLS